MGLLVQRYGVIHKQQKKKSDGFDSERDFPNKKRV